MPIYLLLVEAGRERRGLCGWFRGERESRERGRETMEVLERQVGFRTQAPKTSLFYSHFWFFCSCSLYRRFVSCNFHSTSTISGFPVIPCRLFSEKNFIFPSFSVCTTVWFPETSLSCRRKFRFLRWHKGQMTVWTFPISGVPDFALTFALKKLSSSSWTQSDVVCWCYSAIMRILDMSSLGFSANCGRFYFQLRIWVWLIVD